MSIFTRYELIIETDGRLAGGIPKDAKLVEGWILARAKIPNGEQMRLAMLRTLQEMGVPVGDNPTDEQLHEAVATTVGQKSTNGFKTTELPDGSRAVCIEGRQVKALLKEAANIVWSGQRFGPTRKAAKGYVAERLFVLEDTIPLYREFGGDTLYLREPDGVHLFIGHVPGPKGEQSTLTYYEYADKPMIKFTVAALHDCLTPKQWEELMEHAELNGIGSLRSQSFGTFRLVDARIVKAPQRRRMFQALHAAKTDTSLEVEPEAVAALERLAAEVAAD